MPEGGSPPTSRPSPPAPRAGRHKRRPRPTPLRYGFYDECKRRYTVKLWRIFGDCFNCMPLAAVVGDKILCMHGGLSPELDQIGLIRDLGRPTEVPEHGLLCDLLWADPDPDIQGWGSNMRGISYTFGHDVVQEFLRKHDLDLIVRAHQVVEDGYVRLEQASPTSATACCHSTTSTITSTQHHSATSPSASPGPPQLRVSGAAAARDDILGPQLLWRVR